MIVGGLFWRCCVGCMVVLNGEGDIRFARSVAGVAILAMLATVAFCIAAFFTFPNALVVGGALDAALWTIVGLLPATVLFAGMLCIAHVRFTRMRRDRDYWTCMCNEYRQGRAARHERAWKGLNPLDDIHAMDKIDAELPDRWNAMPPEGAA